MDGVFEQWIHLLSLFFSSICWLGLGNYVLQITGIYPAVSEHLLITIPSMISLFLQVSDDYRSSVLERPALPTRGMQSQLLGDFFELLLHISNLKSASLSRCLHSTLITYCSIFLYLPGTRLPITETPGPLLQYFHEIYPNTYFLVFSLSHWRPGPARSCRLSKDISVLPSAIVQLSISSSNLKRGPFFFFASHKVTYVE